MPLVLERRGADQVHAKGEHDLVTATDVLVEQELQAFLGERVRDAQFVGEEGGQSLPAGGRFWLVDPICGTENYAAGLPLYATNIALVEGREVSLAVAADGANGDIYVGERGRGAFRVRQGQQMPLTVSAKSRAINLDPAPWPTSFGTRLTMAVLAAGDWDVRVLSSSIALPYLAAGYLAAAAYTSSGVPVHFAAGLLLAEEAGATVTDGAGERWTLHSPIYVASASEAIHAEVLDLVRRVAERS
jgi:myo-inositol-1(or 4)-monophosphatase